MRQDGGIKRICPFHKETENEPDHKGVGQLLGIHMQKAKQQCAEKSSLPFAEKLIAAHQDATGKNFLQKGGDHRYRKHGDDQTGLLNAFDRLFHGIGKKQAHQIGKQTHNGLYGNAEGKNDQRVFPPERIQTKGLPDIFFGIEKIKCHGRQKADELRQKHICAVGHSPYGRDHGKSYRGSHEIKEKQQGKSIGSGGFCHKRPPFCKIYKKIGLVRETEADFL